MSETTKATDQNFLLSEESKDVCVKEWSRNPWRALNLMPNKQMEFTDNLPHVDGPQFNTSYHNPF